jgi:hypothetical protein
MTTRTGRILDDSSPIDAARWATHPLPRPWVDHRDVFARRWRESRGTRALRVPCDSIPNHGWAAGFESPHNVLSRSSRSRSQGEGCESKTSVERRRARELDTLDHREAPARSHPILRRAWSWSGAATMTALRCAPTLGGIRDRRTTSRRGLATDLLRRSTRSRANAITATPSTAAYRAAPGTPVGPIGSGWVGRSAHLSRDPPWRSGESGSPP